MSIITGKPGFVLSEGNVANIVGKLCLEGKSGIQLPQNMAGIIAIGDKTRMDAEWIFIPPGTNINLGFIDGLAVMNLQRKNGGNKPELVQMPVQALVLFENSTFSCSK